MDDAKKKMILSYLDIIERSELSVSDYFKKYKIPFSKSQYYIYKKQFKLAGLMGIQDKRKQGGNRKINEEAEGFLYGYVKSNPNVSLEILQQALIDNFELNLSVSAISRAIKRISGNQISLTRGRKKSIHAEEIVVNSVGGFEIIIAIAYHLGWPQKVADLISDEIRVLKKTERYKINAEKIDKKGRSGSGKFLRGYNERKDVVANRFSTITEKRKVKNWQSMDIVRDNPAILIRKSLAVLSLPVVTMNGNVRSVDLALGDSLKHLCGFNYKQSTISKYLSELKYLGISTRLLKNLPGFWKQFWGDELADEGPLVCYYIDGNTKALWSSQRVKQNKVTMLGRVMGCLEQVFIHDCFGHPIYFETFSGHGPVGESILGLFEKIEDSILAVSRSATKVYRAIAMDSASNSVKTLRAFSKQKKYYYVTPLDDNQWNERKILKIGCTSRYRYGKATLTELEIELEDSNEKGYLISSRAIKIDWDNGKMTVLLTNLPSKIVDSSDIAHSYFRRWPAQELQFRYSKAVVALNRIAGYGRREVEDSRVIEAQEKASEQIEKITTQLEKPIQEISRHEKSITKLIKKERQIRTKCKIEKGKRLLPDKQQKEFDEYVKRINSHKRTIKKIEKENGNKFERLRKHQKK